MSTACRPLRQNFSFYNRSHVLQLCHFCFSPLQITNSRFWCRLPIDLGGDEALNSFFWLMSLDSLKTNGFSSHLSRVESQSEPRCEGSHMRTYPLVCIIWWYERISQTTIRSHWMIGSFRELGGATVIITPATQRGGEGGPFCAAEKTRSSKLHPHPKKKKLPLPLLSRRPLGVWQPGVLQDREALRREIRRTEYIGRLSLQDIFVRGCKSTAVQITKDPIDPVCSSGSPLGRGLSAPSRQGPIAQAGLCSLQQYGP